MSEFEKLCDQIVNERAQGYEEYRKAALSIIENMKAEERLLPSFVGLFGAIDEIMVRLGIEERLVIKILKDIQNEMDYR